jgi:hypothetical protein
MAPNVDCAVILDAGIRQLNMSKQKPTGLTNGLPIDFMIILLNVMC